MQTERPHVGPDLFDIGYTLPFVAALGGFSSFANARQITLSNDHWTVQVSLDTLEVTAQPAGKKYPQCNEFKP